MNLLFVWGRPSPSRLWSHLVNVGRSIEASPNTVLKVIFDVANSILPNMKRWPSKTKCQSVGTSEVKGKCHFRITLCDKQHSSTHEKLIYNPTPSTKFLNRLQKTKLEVRK